MSDCSTAAMVPKEPPKTCGMCLNNSYCHTSGDNRLAELCARFRSEDATSSHRPDTLEQRYQQLEQVARDMLQDMREAENWLDYFTDKDSDELYMIGTAIQSAEGRLEALGVILDD